MAIAFLNASTEYLEVDSCPVSGTEVSISCWFWKTSAAAEEGLIWIGDETVGNVFHRLTLTTGSQVRMAAQAGGSTSSATTSTTYSTSTWHHAFCTAASAGNDRSVYLDNGGVGNSTSTRNPAAFTRTSIGRKGDLSPDAEFDGAIAEVGIWSVVLNATERGLLASGVSPLLIRPGSLLLYVPMIGADYFDRIGGLTFSAGGTPTIQTHPPIIRPWGYQTALSPGDSTLQTATPTIVEFTYTLNAPTVVPGPVSVTPTPVECTFTVPEVSVIGDISETPSPVGIEFTVPTPTSTSIYTVSPSAVECTMTVPTPTISLSTAVTPTPVRYRMQIPTPVVTGGDAVAGEASYLIPIKRRRRR